MKECALTIVIPAYNEEDKLSKTVEEAVQAAREELAAFEVIVIDDGSTDKTADVANALEGQYDEVRTIHQPRNMGVGAAYQRALEQAQYPKITLIPGDNPFEQASVQNVFRNAGRAEILVSYRENPRARTPLRRILSMICTSMLRLAVRRPIRDAHSMFVWPVDKARRIPVPRDYRYHLTSLSALMRDAESYTEIPIRLNPKPDHSSGVMRLGVVWGLGVTMLRILAASLFGGAPKSRPRKIPEPPPLSES